MKIPDWGRHPTLVFAILFSGVQMPYILLTGLDSQTPPWARIVALVFPVCGVATYIWYVQRYSTHQDRDRLFRYAGRGSVLGGVLYATPGVGITLQQRTVALPILNPDVLIIELWLGGSLIGLVVGHLYGEVGAEKARLTRLNDATQDLILGTDVADIAERTVAAGERILGLDTAAIYAPEDETTLEPLAATERTKDVFDGVPTIESRDAIAWSAYDSGAAVFVDDVRDHPDTYNPGTPVRSEMAVPVGDVGVFLAASTEVAALDGRDRVLTELLISNAGAAMGRATNEAMLREREQKLERLQERSQRLMYTQTREETANVAVEAARDVIGARLNGVHLLNEAGDTLEGSVMTEAAYETFGEAPSYSRDNEEGSSDAIVWEAFERGESLYIEDTHDYGRLTEEPLTRCVLVYPVGDHGVFIASDKQPRSFDEIDRTLFETLAPILTSAFDRVEREQTVRRREARLQQHRQRLTVLNRVLRHDIRNHVNVISSHVTQLERSVGESPELSKIRSNSQKILQLGENARRIQKTIEQSNGATAKVDVTDSVEENIAALTERSASVDVHTDIPEEARVVSNGLLDAAIENLLANAVDHNDSDSPEIDVAVASEPDDDEVVVRIADNGPGIPAEEREVFEQKEETPLRHSSGLGLWLVHWIIEDIDGTVEIEDRQPRGTLVKLRLPQSTTELSG